MSYKICEKVCNECPFHKKALKGYLGQKNNSSYLEEIIEMWQQEKPFPCHQKIDKFSTFEEIKKQSIPLCRGYICMYKNSFKIPRDKELKKLADSSDTIWWIYVFAGIFTSETKYPCIKYVT